MGDKFTFDVKASVDVINKILIIAGKVKEDRNDFSGEIAKS